MKIQMLRQLAFISVAILFSSQSYSGLSKEIPASFQDEPAWVAFAPEGEELTLMIPAWPTVRNYPVSTTRDPDHETILEHRAYSGYGSGLIFIIESYKAKRPQGLGRGPLTFADNGAVFERDISFDGITAKQYRSTYEGRSGTYTRHFVRFATKEHVYMVTLATLEDTNAVVDRFLSSLRLRRPDDRTTNYSQHTVFILGYAFSPTQVSRRAIIVWKSEPFYTDQARAHQVVGTVKLEAVLGADGYVANINVIEGLKDGLTESAIDAARNIRFFPAEKVFPGEKDSRPVGQQIMLEYNFNLF
jgi:TonB family protein